MKKVVFFFMILLVAMAANVKAQEMGAEVPVIIDDRFFGTMYVDVMIYNHLSQDFYVHKLKQGELTYDCGVKGDVVVSAGGVAYLNLTPARFLMPLTFEDEKGVTNVTYENEFQAPYLALQFSFDGSYDPLMSRGYKWIFSMKKKEIHVCATSQEAEKFNSETSIGIVLMPLQENLPRVALQNESSYLIHVVTPGLSFSGKTLDKNGGELGMSIADRQKITKGGFWVIQVSLIKELGERSVLAIIEIPVVEGSKVAKITDKFFPEISRGGLNKEDLIETFWVNRTKHAVVVEGMSMENGDDATLNLFPGQTAREVFLSKKGFTAVSVVATVNGQLIRSDLLVPAVEDGNYQIIYKNGKFEVR